MIFFRKEDLNEKGSFEMKNEDFFKKKVFNIKVTILSALVKTMDLRNTFPINTTFCNYIKRQKLTFRVSCKFFVPLARLLAAAANYIKMFDAKNKLYFKIPPFNKSMF